MSARRARLARCQPPRHRVDGAAVAVVLLGDDFDELAPARVRDRAGQATVFDHSHDVEVFDVDHLVVANQRQCLLVVIVPPRPGHLVVCDSNLAPRLVPVVRSLLPAELLPLQTPQLPQLATQMFGVGHIDSLTVGGGDRRQPSDPDINPGLPFHRLHRCGRDVDDEAGVVMTIWFADDRDARRLRRQIPRPTHPHLTNFGHKHPPTGSHCEPVAGEPKRLPVSLSRFEAGRPTLRPLCFPLVESKKLRQARRESLTDCTNATLGASHS